MDGIAALHALRRALADADLTLPTPTSAAADSARRRAIRRLDDHVLPRAQSLDAPLLCVVGGSTGSGKSTMFNSLVGEVVSSSSPIRPTTRRPVLLHHGADAPLFEGIRVLPELARVRIRAGSAPTPAGHGSTRELEVREHQWLPAGLALLDSPDVDSVSEENRDLARQLLDAADLWVFVTTAARYADAVPWELLSAAGRSGIAVAVVLNRVPGEAAEAVGQDLRRMMADKGLGSAPLFTVEEQRLRDGLLPADALAPLATWLRELVADSHARTEVARRALTGSLTEVLAACSKVSTAAAEITEELQAARDLLDSQRAACLDRLRQATADGTLLRGEVMARWQDVVGAADLTRSLSRTFAGLRDRVTAFVLGRPTPVAPVEDALEAGLAALIHEELLRVREDAERAWRGSPATRDLVGTLEKVDEARVERLAGYVTREWQKDLLALVRTVGESKRAAARIAAIGVNVVAVALIIVLFASTGGLTGVEVGVSAGSAVLAQKLLETIFGDQAVRSMTTTAKARLMERVGTVIDDTLAPMEEALPPTPDTAALDSAVKEVSQRWETHSERPNGSSNE
ncbi:dynamin family protein [Schaalia sp. 19OD2882]|uniref:dynamin family protein n=1 Tax=Schaalia sp. 19OD2882 TaxID=2794089 RepID=UPI001C1EB690|nr:dynamin family protein [Schaalia sp. 19OD2882]QWW20479.1 dynamin family protein [Schaalia sp. 19OD2882]